jgi:hypothetical protein
MRDSRFTSLRKSKADVAIDQAVIRAYEKYGQDVSRLASDLRMQRARHLEEIETRRDNKSLSVVR